ncbi:hypothetical protein U3450_000703 [Bacillus cytotoxicus]|uniref:hypothetical protein n=1 Tax=Bacillus cereus group sp. BfR-BA-01431 TaxID=2920347 RepID=UPI001F56CFCF|nr:hypothetical protein [Bacillus cereus group sp. BfR-BA-01431]EMA6341841.1 hypothetical protein [Bacillus cytotoxicus]
MNYEQFDRMTDGNYFSISRMSENSVIQEIYDFKIPGITQNHVEDFFRLLKIIDSKGNALYLLTNLFDLEPEENSYIYHGGRSNEKLYRNQQNIDVTLVLNKNQIDIPTSIQMLPLLL